MRNQTIAALALITATIAAPAGAQRGGAPMAQAGASYPMGGVPNAGMQARPMPPMAGNPGRPPVPQQNWNGNGGGQQWAGNGGQGQHWNGNGGQHWNGNGGGQHWGGNGLRGSRGGSHWGGQIGGHWSGGMNAPGGWNAYRRPSRGWRLPSYWFTPDFFISDYGDYGLASPPYGYNWSRYYDDAVLVDGSGRVRDYVGGIDWDRYDEGYDSGYGSEESYSAQGGYASGAPYPPPVPGNGGVTTYSSGGYYANGYYYPPATTTTVTIQQAPSVTTTTTEYVETVKTRYVARKAWRPKPRWHPRPKWHPKPRAECVCGS